MSCRSIPALRIIALRRTREIGRDVWDTAQIIPRKFRPGAFRTGIAERGGALPHLTADDLLSLENVRRYLRTLETELPEREAAAAAALAALREAERTVDRAQSAAAVEESEPLASAIEKTAARAAEKLRAQLHGLAERVEDARRHASQAEDPTPMLPIGVWHFAQADASAEDGALLMAVGRALLALREAERAEVARAKEAARSEKAREREEAARRAWDALPAAAKVDAFDRSWTTSARASPATRSTPPAASWRPTPPRTPTAAAASTRTPWRSRSSWTMRPSCAACVSRSPCAVSRASRTRPPRGDRLLPWKVVERMERLSPSTFAEPKRLRGALPGADPGRMPVPSPVRPESSAAGETVARCTHRACRATDGGARVAALGPPRPAAAPLRPASIPAASIPLLHSATQDRGCSHPRPRGKGGQGRGDMPVRTCASFKRVFDLTAREETR